MALTDLIPPQFRLLAGLVLLGVVAGCAAVAGAKVERWRLEADFTQQIADKDKEISGLKDALKDQNHAVDIAHTQTVAADEKRALAERLAGQQNKQIDKLAALVKASQATDCKGVLSEAWEAR